MEKQYDAQAALQPGQTQQEAAPQQGVLKSPEDIQKQELSKADQGYISGLMKLLHGKETAPAIEEMLKAGPPEKTIPTTALQVNAQMEQAVGKKPPLETCLIAGVYLVQDLIEIGNTAGYFQLESEEQIKPILQDTIEQYIKAGLEDGTIDPIELQSAVEPLMDDDQRNTGMQAAQLTGVPEQPNEHTAMAAYGKHMESQGIMKGSAQQGGNQ